MSELDDEVMKDLYNWVDQIPLSRPKRNIARDFSDGAMMAETMKHFFPHMVDMHNYPDCSAVAMKRKNWQMLNWKVFKKLNFELSEDVIDSISQSKPGTIERVLLLLRTKMDRVVYENQRAQQEKEEQEAAEAAKLKKKKKGGPGANVPPVITKKAANPKPPSNVGGGPKPNAGGPPQPSNNYSTGSGGGLVAAGGGRNATESHKQLLESDFVTHREYDNKVNECMAKDETIEILQAKVRRLEHLLQLKDVRIDDLQRRVEEFSGHGGAPTIPYGQGGGGWMPPAMYQGQPMHMNAQYPNPAMYK